MARNARLLKKLKKLKVINTIPFPYLRFLEEFENAKTTTDQRAFILVTALATQTKALKIRGSYSPRSSGYLDDVKLETARRGASGAPANWIVRCNCPDGYVGQFCESCAPGFCHEPANGGPFARCVFCNCNGHADICEAESGRCIYQHNTAGDNCERCARGYYGNALKKTNGDCNPCPCPNEGACIELADETVVCLESL